MDNEPLSETSLKHIERAADLLESIMWGEEPMSSLGKVLREFQKIPEEAELIEDTIRMCGLDPKTLELLQDEETQHATPG